MSKGQVTIPKEVRKVLGVQSGDKVTFVVEGKTVRVMNSASYAMRLLQQDMSEVADRLGVEAEEDVASLISSVRSERQ
ncbi:MAG: AbrB/MazE/SpoVT family DNA-binding domain-containing protein [Olsenella sp.]|nr:AbrB/MazE/SpoVT family DNA-binding domain-containing protein [Olsenella sp.]MCI2126833.1 AbrB/MazE/SpoVT family DNA-binding domain-containing protein [Olsenella sp.]MCI2187425.1 AbrB/MazE/SpoVT family DNA-binding domain-containing protein [Olsenella sp.]